ncbi:MAG: T9SS type A sorting domain-containing protein [Bacteroidales bacterium]|nr:T9SS type A sorting domain-containing protein [Bacteroidales bacterium]MBN2763819.1 T9SS type A sorting domain-containing protein [Bacteroidales bacterium]
MKKPIFLYLLLLLFPLSVLAQEVTPEVIASSGDTYKTANNQISWTLGEVVIETYIAGSSVLTQGFQQPGIMVEVGYSDPVMQLQMNVYPVPATSYVTVEFQDTGESLSVELYNMQGGRVHAQPVNSQRLQIDLNALPAAEYILKIVTADHKMIKSYTIIKQQ